MKKLLIIFVLLFIGSGITIAQPAPADGLTGVSILPVFTWSGSGDYYLQITKTQGNYSSPTLDIHVNSVTTFSLSETDFTGASGLENNTIYYWRIYDKTNSVSIDGEYHFTTIPSVSISLQNPADASTIFTTSTQFSWSLAQAQGNLQFKIQIDENTSAPTAAEWASAGVNQITSSTFYNATLTAGKKYYWRVIVLSASGDIINYSSVYSVTVSGGTNVTPIPSYPTNNASVYTNTPTLYWYLDTFATGLTYQVCYVDAATNATGAVDGNGKLNGGTEYPASSTNFSNNLYLTLPALNAGVKYYWQARVYYNSSYGAWSDVESFTTNGEGTLLKPTLSYPIDNVTVYTTSPFLYWYVDGSSAGLTFDVYYKTSSGSYPGTPNYSTTDLYKQALNLTPGETYTWKVVARNSSGSTLSSDEETFAITGGVSNGYPVATYPKDNPTIYSTKPTLYWYLEGSSSGLTKYVVRYKASTNSSNWNSDYTGSFEVTNLNQTYYTFTADLTYGEKYYWAVAASDGSNLSAWSTGSFTIVGGSSSSIVLSQPSNGGTVYSTSQTLYWYVNGSTLGIQGYELIYSKSDTWASSVTTAVGPSGLTNLYYSAAGLTAGATYYWKVRAWYGGSTYSNYSDTWTFAVSPGSSPMQPVIGGPADNVIIETTAPTLSWTTMNSQTGGSTYSIELADNPDFTNPVEYNGIENNRQDIWGLTPGAVYYWKVTAVNGTLSSYQSSTASFRVDDNLTGISGSSEFPNTFTVRQNYPNPFNPETRIDFTVPKNGPVSIKIFNLLGQEIRTLLNGVQSAGTHSVIWNGKDNSGRELTSGIYIYRAAFGDNSISKKMILMK